MQNSRMTDLELLGILPAEGRKNSAQGKVKTPKGVGGEKLICPPNPQASSILSSKKIPQAISILSSNPDETKILIQHSEDSDPTPILEKTPQKFSERSEDISAQRRYSAHAPLLNVKDIDGVQALDEIVPGWRDSILVFATEGMSETEIRVALCTINSRFQPHMWYALKEREILVQEVFEQARAISESWWLAQMRQNLSHDKDTRFEASAWIFSMKNHFNWRDTKPEPIALPQMAGGGNGSIMSQVRARITQTETTTAVEMQSISKPNKRSNKKPNKKIEGPAKRA